MEIELYNAFISLGLDEQKARGVADSVPKEIDSPYTSHSSALVTQKHLAAAKNELTASVELATTKISKEMAELKSSLVTWMIGLVFGGMVGLAGLVYAIARAAA